MQRFRSASSTGKNWRSITAECLAQLGDVPNDANLGFVYATDPLAGDLGAVVAQLRRNTGIAHWVGTVGMGICADNREIYDQAALTIMLGAFPDDSFQVFPTFDPEVAAAVADPQNPARSHQLAVVHGDPRSHETPELVRRIAEHIPFLVGGLSSSQNEFPQIADELCTGGISGVVFSDQVSVASSLTQGCSPIGGKHQITSCHQNVIETIDDQPALDVFKEEIGEILARDLNRVAGYIFVGLPVAGSDTGDYVVRNLLGIDPNAQSLIIGEWVEPGQNILFCRRDGRSAQQDMIRSLRALKQRLQKPIKGGLYFSCLGRGRYLFGEDSEELRAIHSELGEFPLVGFFANGEIANNQLYGYTGVLTLFL